MGPAISVVVTTYNQAQYIAGTIASVLAQTHRDLEVILIDDGSTDSTPGEVAPYLGDITYIRQDNRGVAAARNAGIRQARGRMLAFLDGDDLWSPEKLERQLQAWRARPSSGIVVTDGVEFEGARIIRASLMNPAITPRFDPEGLLTLRCYGEMIRQNLITTTSQVMVPRDVIDRVGLSDERFPVSSDWDLYLRIAAEHDVTFLSANLVRYRYHAASASGPRSFRSLRWGLDEIRILRKHVRIAHPEMRQAVRGELRTRTRFVAEQAYYQGLASDRAWTRRYLFDVLIRNPTSLAAGAYFIGAWAPPALTRRLGRLVRRVIGLRESL